MTPPELDWDALRAVFRRYPEILLFGSYADGTARPENNIDLGILPRTPALHERLLDLLADLTAAGFDWMDLGLYRVSGFT